MQATDSVWMGLKDLPPHPAMPSFMPKEGFDARSWKCIVEMK